MMLKVFLKSFGEAFSIGVTSLLCVMASSAGYCTVEKQELKIQCNEPTMLYFSARKSRTTQNINSLQFSSLKYAWY